MNIAYIDSHAPEQLRLSAESLASQNHKSPSKQGAFMILFMTVNSAISVCTNVENIWIFAFFCECLQESWNAKFLIMSYVTKYSGAIIELY